MRVKDKILYILPAICVMIGIFYFSSQTAIQSAGLSSNITERILVAIQDLFHITSDSKQDSFLFHMIEIIIRKAAHMAEYAILAVTVGYPLYIFGKRRWRLILWSEVISVIYAMTDEFHQLFVPGRSGQITDILIDGCGAFLGCIIFFLISSLVKKKD